MFLEREDASPTTAVHPNATTLRGWPARSNTSSRLLDKPQATKVDFHLMLIN